MKQAKFGPQTREKSDAGKLLPLVGVVLSAVASMQAATQTAAHLFNHHPQLGARLGNIYAPWSVVGWYKQWALQYPSQFEAAMYAGLLGGSAGLLATLMVQTIKNNSSQGHAGLHGSARWAQERDIRAAGLLPKKPKISAMLGLTKEEAQADAVYVGGWLDSQGRFQYLRHSGPEHVLTYAPTRSGKGVGLVVPTLLSWSKSCVVTDLKGELWALTAGWRQQYANNKVLRFEPASMDKSIRWNPLEEIRIGTEYEVGDVQNLALLIIDPDGNGLDSGGNSAHFKKTAWALLTGVLLHAIYKARNDGTTASLATVDEMLSDPNRPVGELWMEMATYSHFGDQNHPVVGNAARDILDKPDDEAGSVLSTAKVPLALFRDPVVAKNVSACDFKIKDLMNHTSPLSLYIVTQPVDKGRLRPLVRILINMIIRLNADRMDFENGRPKEHYKHKLLMMLDEFPSLGKLEVLQESLAFVAGYGIKCYLICQDLNQLKSRETGYGPDETITSNCHVQNAYPPNRIETAEHLSRLTGNTTVIKERITISGRRASAMLGQVSRGMEEVQRALLTPDECIRMKGPLKDEHGAITEPGHMLVYVAGYPAIYGQQPLYFQDPVFQARAQIPAPDKSDRTTAGKVPEVVIE